MTLSKSETQPEAEFDHLALGLAILLGCSGIRSAAAEAGSQGTRGSATSSPNELASLSNGRTADRNHKPWLSSESAEDGRPGS
jgi:hypothetical protein